MISKMALSNQSHFPRFFFSIPESHLAGFCRFYKMTLPIGKKGPLCFITLWYHSIVVLISFCVFFFIYTSKIYFNPVCNYLYQLCTNRRRYFICLRGTNTTPALLCPQLRKCFVTVQLLHVFDVDDCILAVVNVNYEQVCQCYFVYVFCLIPPPPHTLGNPVYTEEQAEKRHYHTSKCFEENIRSLVSSCISALWALFLWLIL